MKKILCILALVLSVQCFGQVKCLVLNQRQRDSLVNILMKKTVIKNYCNNRATGQIDIDPIQLKDSTKYFLPWDIFNKPEWLFVKQNIPTKYINNITVRMVADSEFVKTKMPGQ